jgi:hypothetical protein
MATWKYLRLAQIQSSVNSSPTMSTEKPEAVHDEESSAAAPITAEGGSTMPHLTPRTIMAIIVRPQSNQSKPLPLTPD